MNVSLLHYKDRSRPKCIIKSGKEEGFGNFFEGEVEI